MPEVPRAEPNPSSDEPSDEGAAPSAQGEHGAHGPLAPLALAALGVVFGDIGTSPLYTLRECVAGEHGVGVAVDDVLGVLSLIAWSLTMVVTVKYLTFVMRADNHGEGGILALLALLPHDTNPLPASPEAPPVSVAPPSSASRRAHLGWIAILIIIGAALLYGDGIITPAISVLSALEGLQLAAPSLDRAVVPLTCIVLIGLFAIQKRGTGGVGRLFGPVMLVWFTTIAGLGLWHLTKHPGVLAALNPVHAVGFFARHGIRGMLILGSVVLAVTGGEALYADMGHFGARAIRVAWLWLVMPALLLCYFGQGALLLVEPSAIENPFFRMVPDGIATYALVGLSAFATVIASQALISGAFSLTHQAVQLGYFPRVTITHTSSETEGQIYVPEINWGLAIACVALVLWKQHSSALAAAYGIAVCGTMGITSIAYFMVVRIAWRWPLWRALLVLVLFLSFDLPFLGANLLKFMEGGYVPIAVAAALLVMMVVWKRGRFLLAEQIALKSPPVDKFFAELDTRCPVRAPGTGVFLASMPKGIPPLVLHHVDRIHVLHEHVILLTILIEHVPVMPPPAEGQADPRFSVKQLGHGFTRVVGRCGFMEKPDVVRLLGAALARAGLDVDLDDVTYYVGRETFLATSKGKMGALTESFFAFLARNSRSATDYFELPPEQVVELGSQIDL